MAKGGDLVRVAVVTTSRADYGIYQSVLSELERSPKFDLNVVVGGQHLESRFGDSIDLVESDGYKIAGKVACFAGDSGPRQTVSGMALALEGFADVFVEMQPDVVLVLGDRYEMFAAATAAYTLGIPIGHIAGGDVTTGALDEAYRHSITKMATLHFTTSDAASRRVVRMGEHPSCVLTTGTPALDHLSNFDPVSRVELAGCLGIDLPSQFFLVSFHPETNSQLSPSAQVQELVRALDSLEEDVGVVVTGPNSDPGSAEIRRVLIDWVNQRENTYFIENLGIDRYLHTASHAAAVVGNSSSALYEVPSLGTWSIDLGGRQQGRERASSVLHAPLDSPSIVTAFIKALSEPVPATRNPYGEGGAAVKIVDVLDKYDFSGYLNPDFYEGEGE